ncbi:MAG TPA: DUF1501 domain-containing protein [Phenylobacterium sp.]|nr:DUF1501 domain-containing protein [Phenylobacterium sp.]
MTTKTHGPSRRNLLAGLALYGAAAPLALNLSAIGKAAAQAVGPTAPYRALVCIFLQGGNDSNNLLLATDQGSFSQYWAARISGSSPIALMPVGTAPVAIGGTSSVTGVTVKTTDQTEHWGGVLPIAPSTPQLVPAANKVGTANQTRTFALHPLMPATQDLFAAGKVAAIANVGTLLAPLTKAAYQHPTATTQIPQRLFSHADQQAAWQSGQLDGAATGWGGLMADTFQPAAASGGDFSSITTASNTPFPQGAATKSFRVNFGSNKATAQTITLVAATGTHNESATFLTELRASLQDGSSPNQLVQTYAAAVTRSIQTSVVYDAAMSAAGGPYSSVPAPPPFTNPIAGKVADNPLADQLEAVVQTAAAHAVLGVQRQVFFVQYGSFDTHDGENGRQGLLLAQLDHALAYLDSALTQVGLSQAVTAFTASDFNRTFTTNGDGTDHAWGGHHLVIGGAVRGGDIYGAYPTLGVDRAASGSTMAFTNPDGAGTALVPSTSVETYMATMATWMGVTPAQMATIFPNLANFPKQNLGFMNA